MKKLLLASAFVLATTTLARADEVWSFGGTLKCSEVLADQRNKVSREQLDMWIMGAWSGANANDQTDGKGLVGKGATVDEIVAAVISECRKNSKQDIQDAFYAAYFRYRDMMLAGADS